MEMASRYPPPDFYRDFPSESRLSNHLLETDTTVAEIRRFVAQRIEGGFGHGMDHAEKVALDAGTLMVVEGKITGVSGDGSHRKVVLALCAGLFHDIKRREKDHPEKGAIYAREVLCGYGFVDREVNDIVLAIANHEAFKDPVPIESAGGKMLSDCLYDAESSVGGRTTSPIRCGRWSPRTIYRFPNSSPVIGRVWRGWPGLNKRFEPRRGSPTAHSSLRSALPWGRTYSK